MSYWICCNKCYLYPSPERRLAVTTCGHLICNVCYQQGTQGNCQVCGVSCQVSPLSNKSNPEVKALFSDIKDVAAKHFAEIRKVVLFQTRHQKRLLTYYQQRNEKLEEVLVKMKQEIQQMTKKLNEQTVYITKLENCLQQQSDRPLSASKRSQNTSNGQKPVPQIPYNSSMCLTRHSSSSNVSETMVHDDRFKRLKTTPTLPLISPKQEQGHASQRSSIQNMMDGRSLRLPTVGSQTTIHRQPSMQELSFSQSPFWSSPTFKPPTSFRHSMSSLVCPRP
ncbi:putative E3 SUMO-protein ligase RNF212 isoform X2 [Cynoglossus semilaevis]|uniref:Ring finger protein 212 n=1 Tax=Cynoglossus semilaevis TaxID=244447 RepID=A0A3P8US99_CYNSE|nr:probable E3 SUMO-protein ligase RNF212 isoform X2 [Cynoglossus semilaevis]